MSAQSGSRVVADERSKLTHSPFEMSGRILCILHYKLNLRRGRDVDQLVAVARCHGVFDLDLQRTGKPPARPGGSDCRNFALDPNKPIRAARHGHHYCRLELGLVVRCVKCGHAPFERKNGLGDKLDSLLRR